MENNTLMTTSTSETTRRGFLRYGAGLLAAWAALSSIASRAFAGDEDADGAKPGDRIAGTLDYSPFIGDIMIFAGNYAPAGWVFCNGQLLPISQYSALFEIIGTTYGGDGVNYFAVPDLRGRVPLGAGTGAGLTVNYGQRGGEVNSSLTVSNLPAHSHAFNAQSTAGSWQGPGGNVPAADAMETRQYAAAANTAALSGVIQATGGSQQHNNMQPYMALNFVIAVQGDYPF